MIKSCDCYFYYQRSHKQAHLKYYKKKKKKFDY